MTKDIDLLDEKRIVSDNKQIKSRVVLNSSDVWKESPFTICKLKKDKIAVGLLLPKTIEETKQGRLVRIKQEWFPYFVTSKHELLPCADGFQSSFKIKFQSIPLQLTLRWELEDIDLFTDFKEAEYPLSLEEVFNLIVAEYKKYIHVSSPEWYKIHALWDIGTYFFMLFDYYPIMNLWGLQGSGKTKIISLSKCFTLNPTPIMVNPSAASLFRTTHEIRPTKYVDEAEKIWRYDYQRKEVISDDRAELLNGSWQKGSTVPRAEAIGRGFKIVHYNVYSPTMLASINGLKGATEDRSIIHICVKNPAADKRGDLSIDESSSLYQDIRNHLYRHFLDSGLKIEADYKKFSEEHDTKLSSRDLKIWQPLLIIAKTISDDLFNEIKAFAEKQTNIKRNDTISEDSLEHKLILEAYKLIGQENKVYVKALADFIGWGSKTVSAMFDKLGLRDFRDKDMFGSVYKISQEEFKRLIKQTYQNLKFSSYSSYSSYEEETIDENKKEEEKTSMTNNDEKEKNMTNNYDEYDGNDEYDGTKGHKKRNKPKIDIQDSVITKIKELDKGSGVKLANISKQFEKESFDLTIKQLLEKGDLFEVKPGIVKTL